MCEILNCATSTTFPLKISHVKLLYENRYMEGIRQ